MMLIALDMVRLDGGTQPRATINSPLFEEYAQAIADGASFPPVVVFYDGTDYWLADGFHRFHAHQSLGLVEINADVRQGDRRAAVLHSVGANADHGWRRSSDDKRRAAMALLGDPEWSHWSDREIARRCVVSHEFVRKLRPDHTVNVDSIDRTFIHPKTGQSARMDTARIGAGNAGPLLVAGRVPDRRPSPSLATTDEVMMGTASRVTGFAPEKLARFARDGEIDGARKEGGSWVFETDKLKSWMNPASAVAGLPAPSGEDEQQPYDYEVNQPMHAAIDLVEALATGVTPGDLLGWWRTYIGAGFHGDAVNRARAWINSFAEGYPAAEQARQSLLARIPEEQAA